MGLRYLLALLLASPAAHAHDTWFAQQAGGLLALGTGSRFPVAEVAVDDRYFANSGCRDARGDAGAIEKVRFTDTTTVLRVRGATAAPQACYVQLAPFEIDLPDDRVEVYFREIRPPAAVVAAWAELRRRGLPFHERYVKSARIDLAPEATGLAVGTAMDALRIEPAGPLAAGAAAMFEVRKDGAPLPGFPVELVNERSPVGLWTRTDGEGRIRVRLPLPGRWLLRGTDLHVVAAEPVRFESWFLAYAFEVR
jgi:hypothetical protein